MQQTRSHHEACRVQKGVGRLRKLCTMRVSVKNSKRTYHDGRHPKRRACGSCNHCADNDRRQCDPFFNKRHRHSEQAKHSTSGHHHRKNHRQCPHRSFTEKSTPQTHRNHCGDVVPSKHWVHETGGETTRERRRVGVRVGSAYKNEANEECDSPLECGGDFKRLLVHAILSLAEFKILLGCVPCTSKVTRPLMVERIAPL